MNPQYLAQLRPRNYLYKYLATGAGSVDMNVDGSSNAVSYSYLVPGGMVVAFHRFTVSMVDGGMQYGSFAGVGTTALTNGITMKVIESDGTTLDFTDGKNIKTNEDFSNLAGVDAIAEPTAGDDFMPIRFTVSKASGGEPMMLGAGDRIQVTINDDLSAVSFLRVMIQGQTW